MPDVQKPFEIKTDASAHALGAVLWQDGRVVAYHSEMFNTALLNFPVYEKQMSNDDGVCTLCSTSKPSNRKLGLISPIPSWPWEKHHHRFRRTIALSVKLLKGGIMEFLS